MILARKDGVPIAFIVWMPYEGGAFIGLAWTAVEHRRSGLYAELVKALEQQARMQGLKHIAACVNGNNALSIEAHQRIFGQPDLFLFRKNLAD